MITALLTLDEMCTACWQDFQHVAFVEVRSLHRAQPLHESPRLCPEHAKDLIGAVEAALDSRGIPTHGPYHFNPEADEVIADLRDEVHALRRRISELEAGKPGKPRIASRTSVPRGSDRTGKERRDE